MGSYWAVVPIVLLAFGFLAALIYERFLGRSAPLPLSVASISAALVVTLGLYFTPGIPFDLTLFTWSFPGMAAPSLALAYYVDSWGSLLASLALFLGLCAQLVMTIGSYRADGDGGIMDEAERALATPVPNAVQNWNQITILAALLILLNLVFAASLIVFFVCWSALAFLLFTKRNVDNGGERDGQADLAGRVDDLTDEPEAKNLAQWPGPEASFLQLAGFGLLGVLVMLAREGQGTALAISLRTVSLGFTSSILAAIAIGAFFGLYPFIPWPTSRVSGGWAMIGPLGAFPALAAFYLLGRLYSAAVLHNTPALSSILGLMGIVTVIVAAARVWAARAPAPIFSGLMAIDLGLVAIAFALADLHTFPAAVFIFLNGVLASHSVVLGNTLLATEAATEKLWRRQFLSAAPWLSLIGLPFTLGFIARWMLLASSSDLRLIVLWPVFAVVSGISVIATLRLLDGIAPAGTGELLDRIKAHAQEPARLAVATVSLLPWLVSLVLGLVPNLASYWIIAPAAAALLGDEYGQLFAARGILPDGYLTAVALAVMLAIIVLAFYVYPPPFARLAANRLSSDRNDGEWRTRLRYGFLGDALDLAAMMVLRASRPDGLLQRGRRSIDGASVLAARLHDGLYEDYCFPALAVLGFIIVFIFLG